MPQQQMPQQQMPQQQMPNENMEENPNIELNITEKKEPLYDEEEDVINVPI